jgi:hypothetical protein
MTLPEQFAARPVIGDGVVTLPSIEKKKMSLVDATVAQMLTMHTLNGAQVTADGRSALAETVRLDHIRASNTISFREATGVRHVTEAGQSSTQANPRS